MNWMAEFFFGAAPEFERQEEDGAGVKWRKSLSRALKRGKKSLKKLPTNLRCLIVGGLVAAVAFVPMYVFVLSPSQKRFLTTIPSIPSLFPGSNTPRLPEFDPEVLAMDPGVQPRRWKYIVIHHSASTRGSAQIFDQAHRDRGWRSLGYDFVIGNGTDQGDGVIAPGPRWYGQEAGAHAHSTEHNEFGIGICLVGNFDQGRPSAAQWAALVNLVRRLTQKYGISAGNIVGHSTIRQGGSTACPGKNFPLQELREAVFFEGVRN